MPKPTLADIHSSHQMGEPEVQPRSLCSAPRFYSVRQCQRCDAEFGEHAAGSYIDDELKVPCRC